MSATTASGDRVQVAGQDLAAGDWRHIVQLERLGDALNNAAEELADMGSALDVVITDAWQQAGVGWDSLKEKQSDEVLEAIAQAKKELGPLEVVNTDLLLAAYREFVTYKRRLYDSRLDDLEARVGRIAARAEKGGGGDA
jgi:hypothetical protein